MLLWDEDFCTPPVCRLLFFPKRKDAPRAGRFGELVLVLFGWFLVVVFVCGIFFFLCHGIN